LLLDGIYVDGPDLDHLKEMGECQEAARLPEKRGPPQIAFSTKEDPFVKHMDVADDAGQR
jgi:hypothetical protein